MSGQILFVRSKNTLNNIEELINNMVLSIGYKLSVYDVYINNYDFEDIKRRIYLSTLVIADVSDDSTDFIIGQVVALNKPILFISNSRNNLNYKYSNYLVQIYGENESYKDFLTEFQKVLIMTIENLKNNVSKEYELKKKLKPNRVFISYSHRDKDYLDRLLVHLKPLERNGSIDIWVDTRIKSGQRWEEEIVNALNNSGVGILLISADFLASDFIVNNELQPLLINAQKKGTRIIPIVIKTCRFLRDTSLNAFQAINDPSKPLMSLKEDDQEKIYDLVAQRVEEIIV